MIDKERILRRLYRKYGAREGVIERMMAARETQNDWTARCWNCGARRMGTPAELSSLPCAICGAGPKRV